MPSEGIDRRHALKTLALGGVGAATAPGWVVRLTDVALAHAEHTAQAPPATASWAPAVLTPRQNETVITLSELIIPQTDTAGAKAAGVNRFIDAVIADAPPAEREQFLGGLKWIDARTRR